ncbi:MAG: hypothetical protein MK135_15895 [Polyangiaceae bacterium]|nr:hypothetical protein [Polyangiaceae bacterium]
MLQQAHHEVLQESWPGWATHVMCSYAVVEAATGGTMSDQSDYTATAKPLETAEAIPSGMYPGPKSISPDRPKAEKPTHYKVICISMYMKDLKRLDDMVDTLKAKGMTKANRSALIRYALSQVDLDQVPQGL